MERKQKYQQAAQWMKDFIDHTIDFHENIKEFPVVQTPDPLVLRHIKEQKIPACGRPAKEVFEEMERDVFAYTSLGQHPRSFACIPSPISLYSWMGDIMTGAYNPHASCQTNGLAAYQIEKNLIHWMCQLAGYPKGSGGLFVSGGSMANLTALTAARDAKLKEADRSRGVIYISDQTHSSVAKGLHIIGFTANQIRKIPSDDAFRMDLTQLKKRIASDLAQDKIPFAVVASAGTTNTGSIDPLKEISAICRAYNMWMHVDGAFGASALLSGRCRRKLDGIEMSDSLSWDAHKWMQQTFACSMVLIRDQSYLENSFATHPEYLKDAQAEENSIEFWDLGPELTRPARSLKLWMTLQILGTDAMEAAIDHSCSMAELAENLVASDSDWEIISHAQLGIVNFRYAPAGLSADQIDAINQNLAKEITDSGYAQIFTTILKGKKVLRLCTLHPETTEEDIRTTIQKLKQSHLLLPFSSSVEKTKAAS